MLLLEQEDAPVCLGLQEVLQGLGNRLPLPAFPRSELLTCLEHEKLFSRLGKDTAPSLTLLGLCFSTSELVSVVLGLKYICSHVVETHYPFNTFAFELFGTMRLFL